MTKRMIVHIGTGKTGSTAIQKTLSAQRQELLKQGIAYWGLNLEYAPTSTKREWQKPGGIGILQRMNIKGCISELIQVLEEALSNTHGDTTVIWSNESIYEMRTVFQTTLQSITASSETALTLVAYARNIPGFLVSAYKQWGIKHKTYNGSILPFRSWVESSKDFLAYPETLASWEKCFPNKLSIYNYDEVDDVVTHFYHVLSLPASPPCSQPNRRDNSTPEDILLALYALHNNRFQGQVLPERISRLLSDYRLFDNGFASFLLSDIYPTSEDLSAHAGFIQEQTDLINDILLKHGQPPFKVNTANSVRKPLDRYQVFQGVLAILLALTVQQDDRINQLEAQLKTLLGD